MATMFSSQAAGSAEQEDLLEDTAWAAETDGQFEGMARSRLQAPTLESMLLRMEEIQVRAAPHKAPATRRSAWNPKGHQ